MEHFTPASSERKTYRSLRTVTRSSSTPLPIHPFILPFSVPALLLSFHVGNLISHIFRKNEMCCEADWERYFSYSSVEVPDSYSGPRPTFPLTLCGVLKLVEAFKHKQVGAIKSTPDRKNFTVACSFSHSRFLVSSSSSTVTLSCSFLERLGDFWEFFQTSTKSRPAKIGRLPYVVHKCKCYKTHFF